MGTRGSTSRRRVGLRLVAVTIVAAIAMVTSQRAQRADQRALPPNFDVRVAKSAEATRYLQRFSDAVVAGAAVVARARTSGVAALKAGVGSLEIIDNPEMGSPEVVSAKPGTGFLTGAAADRAGTMRAFLATYADGYGLSQEQVASLELVADYMNPAGNMAWVEFEQRINGLPVFRGLIRGGFTSQGELVRTTGPLATGLDAASLPVAPVLTAAEAVSQAAANAGLDVASGALVQKSVSGDRITLTGGSMAQDAKAWLLYFPIAPGVARLAWATEVWGTPDAYLILVDAEDGTLLFRKDLTDYQTQAATYAVYKDDSPAPLSPSNVLPGTGTQAPYIARTLVTLIGNEGVNAFNSLGWMNDNTNLTDGNNVEAGIDVASPNGVDAPVVGLEGRLFNFPYDPQTQDPSTTTYRNGEVTDMFYWTNVYHDRLYLLGFTEAGRNFQNDNFGRGGLGADRVSAEAQDSSGTNNANFSTLSDGGRGRMQMYIFNGPTPDRTSGIDHDVLLHELTHGTSNRLHSNAAGLSSTMSGGMGEGWSDFYARALLSTADEDPNGIYAAVGWVTNNINPGFTDNYYYGIRRFPYAVKTNVGTNGKPHNPLTFADIDNTQIDVSDGAFPRGPIGSSNAFEVHNIGEVWCMMLLEVRARFITRLGFDVGNQRVLQFVTDAMKLDPVSPTMLQARDSILAAATAGGTAADRADIWAGFAARGMGFSAQILNAGTGLVVEAFDVPGISAASSSLVSDSIPNGRIDPGEAVTVSLCVSNAAETTSGSVTGTLLAAGGVQSPSGPQAYGTVAPGATVCRNFTFTVGATCGATVSGATVTATLQAVEAGAPTRAPTFNLVLGSLAPSFGENFDAVTAPALPAGWSTTTPTGAFNPFVTSAVTPDTAPNRAVASDLAVTSDSMLVSPVLAAPVGASRVTFRNSYNTEGGWDGGVLEISIAGGVFQDVIAAGGSFQSGGYSGAISTIAANPIAGRNAWTGNSGGYVTTTATLPPAASGQYVVLRWRMTSDSSVSGVGWSVDTIALSAVDCGNTAPSIGTQPQSQTILSGQTATLSVVAVGTPLSYQWYQGASPSTATPIGGATSASYTTPALTATTSYWVQASNGSGVANSNTAAIAVTTVAGHALYGATSSVPACTTVGSACDSDLLLNGRANITGGAEPNQPNTIARACTDGTTGAFQVDESIDRLKVSTLDGLPFEPGKTVRIDATVWVSSLVNDRLDLYSAANAASPAWTLVTTVTPVALGAQTLTANYVLPAGGLQAVRANYRSGGSVSTCSGGPLDDADDLIFAVNPTSGTELIQNGNFSGAMTGWQVFEAPDIVHNSAAGGVFQYHKANPTTTASGQATIFQTTGQPVAATAPLTAAFDIGNADTVRKRISVLVTDSDFSDLAVCTFWLPAGAPLRTYQMRTHPTQAWANASIYFYAASTGTGDYRLDNVSLKYTAAGSIARTDCVDPTAPAAPGGAAGPNLLANPDFTTGLIAPWGLYGDIAPLINNGVFEFLRPGATGSAAGVILQNTGATMTANQILTATFKLGNSSTVRKRVAVLLHDFDFSDLAACTFWLPAGQPLSTYTMRSFATKAWSSATIAVYAATTGTEQRIRLDTVTLQRTPASVALGTECIDPAVIGAFTDALLSKSTTEAAPAVLAPIARSAASTPAASARGVKGSGGLGSGGFALAPDQPGGGGNVVWSAEAWTAGLAILDWAEPIDLTGATRAALSFTSRLSAGASTGEVLVSVDGVTWQTVVSAPATGGWETVDVDLSEFTGRTIRVRFVFDAAAPGAGVVADTWTIGNVVVRMSGRAGRPRAFPVAR